MDYSKIGKRSQQINFKKQKWIPPHNNNAYKANCDANLGLDGYRCMATVIRDSQRRVIAVLSWKEHESMDKIAAEALAVQRALNISQNCCLRDIKVDSDCETLFKEINI